MSGWVLTGGPGLGGPLSLLEETRPVADSMEEVSRMDEIYGLGIEEPVFFCIVDFETEVRWYPWVVRLAVWGVRGGRMAYHWGCIGLGVVSSCAHLYGYHLPQVCCYNL